MGAVELPALPRCAVEEPGAAAVGGRRVLTPEPGCVARAQSGGVSFCEVQCEAGREEGDHGRRRLTAAWWGWGQRRTRETGERVEVVGGWLLL